MKIRKEKGERDNKKDKEGKTRKTRNTQKVKKRTKKGWNEEKLHSEKLIKKLPNWICRIEKVRRRKKDKWGCKIYKIRFHFQTFRFQISDFFKLFREFPTFKIPMDKTRSDRRGIYKGN